MKISKCMTRDVQLASPTQSIRDAAKMMADIDAGSLPVGQDNRLVGMITDRDIAIRAVAEGKSPDTPVREVMSPEVLFCFEDQDIEDAGALMEDRQVRRLVVLGRDQRLTGILSLGDLATGTGDETLPGEILRRVSEPGESAAP